MDPDLRLGLNTKLGLILAESELRRFFCLYSHITEPFNFWPYAHPHFLHLDSIFILLKDFYGKMASKIVQRNQLTNLKINQPTNLNKTN